MSNLQNRKNADLMTLQERAAKTGLSFDFTKGVQLELARARQAAQDTKSRLLSNPYRQVGVALKRPAPLTASSVTKPAIAPPDQSALMMHQPKEEFFVRTRETDWKKLQNPLKTTANFFRDALDMMMYGEKKLADVIAAWPAMKTKDVQQLVSSRIELETMNMRLSRALQDAQKRGDAAAVARMSKLLNENSALLGEGGAASLGAVVPGTEMTNIQVAAAIAEVAVDLLTSGSYSGAMGLKSFRLAKNIPQAQVLKSLKIFNREAPAFIRKAANALKGPLGTVARTSAAYGGIGPFHEKEKPSAEQVALGVGIGTAFGLGTAAAARGLSKLFTGKTPKAPKVPTQQELPLKGGKYQPELPFPKQDAKIPEQTDIKKPVTSLKRAQIDPQTKIVSKPTQLNLFSQLDDPKALKLRQQAAESLLPDKPSAVKYEPETFVGTDSKESRFAKRISGSEKTDPELRAQLTKDQPTYIREHNIDTLARAQKRVASSLDEAAAYARSPGVSAEKTATSIEVIKAYQNQGRHDLAAEMATEISESLSKAGQAIQAAKLYENLSPEAYLIRTQKFIDKQNKKAYRWQKKNVLKDSDAKEIYRLAKKMQEATDPNIKTELAAELGGIMEAYTRSSIGQKISSIQVIAQLLNLKRVVRDIIGNELFRRAERLMKYVATPIDILNSKLTGADRTVSFVKLRQGNMWEQWMRGTSQYLADFKTGAKAGWKGLSTHLKTKFDLPQRTFKSKWNPFYYLERLTGAVLKAPDYASYNRKYQQVIYEQAWLKAKNEGLKGQKLRDKALQYMKELDIKAHELADYEGRYVTFQDDSTVSKGAVWVKRALNLGQDFGLGDLVLKYPKTPGNLLARALEYSPVGYVRAMREIALPFLKGTKANNREIAHAVARASIGTFGLTGLGSYLTSKGIISGQFTGTWDEAKLGERAGLREYQINISAVRRWVENNFQGEPTLKNGDTLYTYDFAEPLSMSVEIAANLNQTPKEQFASLAEAFVSASQTFADQPVLSGVLDLLKGDPGTNILTVLEGAPASFTPTFFNQLRQYLYNEKKMTDGKTAAERMMNKVKAKLPYFAEDLPASYGTLGEPRKDYENPTIFNVFFNPGFLSTYNEDPAAKLVLDLIAATGDSGLAPKSVKKKLSLFGEQVELSGPERSLLQQWVGQRTLQNLDRFATNPEFMRLPEEKQAEHVKKMLSEVGEKATLIMSARLLQHAKETDPVLFKELKERKPKNMKWEDLINARDYIMETGMFHSADDILKATHKDTQTRPSPFRMRDKPIEEEAKEKPEKVSQLILKNDSDAFMATGMIGAFGIAVASRGKKTKPLQKSLSKLANEVSSTVAKSLGKKKDLLAVHSTKREAFQSIVKEGKIWGPSVGVFKKGGDTIPTKSFGDYHFVINKNSVNPKNKEVMFYSSDAFTPRSITDEASLAKVKEMYSEHGVQGSLRGAEFDGRMLQANVHFTERIKSLPEMRKAADKLTTSNKENFSTFFAAERVKIEETAKLIPSRLRDEVLELYGGKTPSSIAEFYDETGTLILHELASMKDGLKNPARLVSLMEDQYSTKITKEQATGFLDSINNAYNSIKWTYMEAKVLKDLSLAKDVDALIVPRSIADEDLGLLKRSGLKYVFYDGTPASLSKAYSKIAKSAFAVGIVGFPNILAQRASALKKQIDKKASTDEDRDSYEMLVKRYKVREGKYAGSRRTIGNIDLETNRYATNPDHITAIRAIYNQMGPVDAAKFKSELTRLNSPLQKDADDLLKALDHYNVSPREFLAVIRQDSGAGTRGKAVETKNPGNIGNTDDGSIITFNTWLEGSIACIRNLAERRVNN